MSRRDLVCLVAFAGGVHAADSANDPPWRARVVDKSEPGEPLTIRGRLLRSPGGTAAPGTVIMVYQTDAQGIYSRKEGHPMDTARLRGQFTSGPNGEYEIVTIRPGSYPSGGAPAHIHVNLVEPGGKPREIFEFFFAGDSNLSGRPRGYVLEPRKGPGGAWLAVQDIALNP